MLLHTDINNSHFNQALKPHVDLLTNCPKTHLHLGDVEDSWLGCRKKLNLVIQDAVVKSIAAFLNTDGGTLLVGVKDKPHEREDPISGIENDFRFLGKDKSIEGFGHAMIQFLNDAFGDQTTVKLYVSISYPRMNEKTVCRVDVKPLPRVRNGEMWAKTKTMGAEEFFYRVSDTTTHASAKSANRYIRHHFEGFSEPVDDEIKS